MVPTAILWGPELSAYERGESLRLVLSECGKSLRLVLSECGDNDSMRIVLQQWFVQRNNIHVVRPGAGRVFESETAARGFIACQHAEVVELPVTIDEPLVLGNAGQLQIEAQRTRSAS